MATASFRAVVFDLDGTLVDSEPRNHAAWRRVFEAHGTAPDEALIRSFVGRRGRDVLTLAGRPLPGPGPGRVEGRGRRPCNRTGAPPRRADARRGRTCPRDPPAWPAA